MLLIFPDMKKKNNKGENEQKCAKYHGRSGTTTRIKTSPGHGTPVSAYVKVVAVLRGDESEVLALRLRAFSHAAADRRLELVGRPQP